MTPATKLTEADREALREARAKSPAALQAQIASLSAEIERLRNDLRDWAECSSIKVTMEGPRLMGWNSSALNRCLAKYEAAALQLKEGE